MAGYLIVKLKVKGVQLLIFLLIIILEYNTSSTGSLNELVNSNDIHVHTIIVELCEQYD